MVLKEGLPGVPPEEKYNSEASDIDYEGMRLEKCEEAQKKKEYINMLRQKDIIFGVISEELATYQPEIALGKKSHEEVSRQGKEKYDQILGDFIEKKLEEMREIDRRFVEENYAEAFKEAVVKGEEAIKAWWVDRKINQGKKSHLEEMLKKRSE